MNYRYLKIGLIVLALAFAAQGCFPPPPPPWYSPYYHHDHHGWHRHWSSLEQPVQSVAQLANRKGGDVGYQGEEVR